MTDKPKKLMTMVCRHCGSQDVLADAYAIWDVGGQCWEVQNAFDKGGYCNKCDGECSIKEVERTEEHIKEDEELADAE